MQKRKLMGSLVAVAALVTGCANQALAPGMSRDEVVSRLGTPTRVVPLAGGERFQYSRQPYGRTTTMVDLDAAGRVVRARQVLNLTDFNRIEIDRWSRDDIAREFGPPASVDHVGSWRGDIWNYYWFDGVNNMFFWVYLDAQGVVRRTQQGIELPREPDDRFSSSVMGRHHRQ